jgi:hypothetical protein
MPISDPIPPRYIRIHHVSSSEMVNYTKLDNKALIEAATASSASQPKHGSKQLIPYTPEEQEVFDNNSRKRTRTADKASLSNNGLSGPETSEDTFVSKPSKKKQKQVVEIDGEEYDAPQRQLPRKDKDRVSMAEHTDDSDDSEDNAAFQAVKSTKPKLTTASRKPSSSYRKASLVANRRKSVSTPIPTSLEGAHPADKELFRMKADGKPWKQIKPVWEKLMGKQTGDSTLSVRYCKMKENFEKASGKDVSSPFLDGVYSGLHILFASVPTARAFTGSSLNSTSSSTLYWHWNLIKLQDTRILKFKTKVEAELEADKWERVARMTEDDGGKVMTAKEVRLRFKEIQNSGFQINGASSDDEMPKATEADLDSIDQELVGVGEANGNSDLSELEQSDIGESMDFQPEIDGAGDEIEELSQAAQKFTESVGEANGLGGVEFDSGVPVH